MQTDKETIFEEVERLKFYDCDYKGRMKLSAILKVSAEIAGRDYTVKGYTHEKLWEKEMVFLLSRVSVKIFSYPREQDELITRTWENGKKGAMFLRSTEIECENGELAASIQSGWVLANPITRHIYKPSFFFGDMPQNEEKLVFAKEIGKIKYDNIVHVGDREVRITDLDENGHVYNSVYADMVCDSFSQENYEKDIDNFRINYISEAVLGERISLYRQDIENDCVFVGKVGEKLCFECEFIWK